MSIRVSLVLSCVLAIAALDAASAAGSDLEFTVEIYNLYDDPATGDGTVPTAREVYDRMHPPSHTLGDLNVKLIALDDAVGRYKQWLKDMDGIVQALFADVGQPKSSTIDQVFDPLEKAITAERTYIEGLIRDHGRCAPSPPPDPTISALWARLPEELDKAEIVRSPEPIQRIIDQLAEIGDAALQDQLLQPVTALLDELRKQEAAAVEGNLVEVLGAYEKALKEDTGAAAATLFGRLRQARESADDAQLMIQMVTGDLLPRFHEVYQDLSDPFLSYIVAHPERWQRIPNHSSVSGDGDTQFILVFERQLDGRFRFVSVDPTKVIQARLRITRKIMEGFVSLAGVAANAFGVPVPAGLLQGHPAADDTIDFSKMTALESRTKKQNEIERRRLEDLRAFAARELASLNKDNAEAVRRNLLRQLELINAGDP